MANVEKYVEETVEASKKIKELLKEFSNILGGEFPWKMEQVMESYLMMYDRFCPFKIGDRVELIKNVNPDESSGWFSSRHFLIQNARGTVENRGYRNGKFVFDIVFDNETWIDNDGNERKVTKKHTFSFSENWLRLVRD